MPRYESSASVSYSTLSTIPGLLLERTGNGAGVTLPGSASSATITPTIPSGFALSDTTDMIFRGRRVQSSSDNDTYNMTVIRETSGELTTSGYNRNAVFQIADGTPAVASAESYATTVLSQAGGVSNVSGETLEFETELYGLNDALSHKSFRTHLQLFRADDDLTIQFDHAEALTTERISAASIFMTTGNISGRTFCKMAFD